MVALIQDSLFLWRKNMPIPALSSLQLVVEGKVKLFRFIDTKTTVYGSPDGHHGGGTLRGEEGQFIFLKEPIVSPAGYQR